MPYGVEIVFTCKISDGLNPHWAIGNKSLAFNDTEAAYRQRGFHIEKQPDGNVTTLTLTVNATGDKNGTEVYCSSRNTHSHSAFLFIVSG